MKPEMHPRYVLITAAYNEGAFIEKTIRSVVSQTFLPSMWVIVSDGSTDQTEEIISGYAEQYPFIQLVRLSTHHGRDFAAKVHAIRAGYQLLSDQQYEFLGILDGDVEPDRDYYEKLIQEFRHDSRLGLAGGFIYEEKDGTYQSRRANTVTSVAGAIQLYRRECYEAVGGLQPLPYGGEDWCAEINARMKGWTVRAFPHLVAHHHRRTGTSGSLIRYCFRQGKMDFSLGALPSFEIVKCLRRLTENPVGALARLLGFALSYCKREPRLVPDNFVHYLRAEQRHKLKTTTRWATRADISS